MKIKYRLWTLSPEERELLEMVLLEEIELQSWYAITYCCILNAEQFLTTQ